MTHWILQNNLYAEQGFAALTSALDRFDLSYSTHRCVPFVGNLEPDASPPPGPVIVMGSYTLADHAKARGWTPGAWLDNLDFQTHVGAWGERMLNAEAKVCRLKDVAPPDDVPFFIRPVHDTKSFTGQVMCRSELDAWQQRVANADSATLNLDTAVIVSSTKQIYSETRTWIVAGRVVTASGYKIGDIKRQSPPHEVDARITAFAQACADLWRPNDAFVLDVADTPEGLRIIEINNLNSAGFYKADMQKLVFALSELVETRTG